MDPFSNSAYELRTYAMMRTMLFVLLVVTSFAGANTKDEPDNLQQVLDAFLATPSLQTWSAFEQSVRDSGDRSPYSTVVAYHVARVQRDYPNSMARTDDSAANDVARAKATAEAAIKTLQEHEPPQLWQLLRVLVVQHFDNSLVYTGAELAARLSPPRFKEVKNEVEKSQPKKKWVFEGIEERWPEP
jgi:hypothetical protein